MLGCNVVPIQQICKFVGGILAFREKYIVFRAVGNTELKGESAFGSDFSAFYKIHPKPAFLNCFHPKIPSFADEDCRNICFVFMQINFYVS